MLKTAAGYSLVEVMASIVILSFAIIPMVAMFDVGLRSAMLGSDYDTARTLANKHLERAKNLSYADVRSNFPAAGANMTNGTYDTPSPISSPTAPHEVPDGFSYAVSKQYKYVPGGGGAVTLANTPEDRGIIEITVTVRWGTSNEYAVKGLRAK